MPPRKEPKETVVYPASKRKPPPFKPQRPSKLPRIPTTESESTQPQKSTTIKPPAPRRPAVEEGDDEDDGTIAAAKSILGAKNDSDSSEDLALNPSVSKPSKPYKASEPPPGKRKPPRQPSPMSVSSDKSSSASPDRPTAEPDPPPQPSQSERIPSIPQPLLIRLLYEHFADKSTKIDKHAIQVLQKYFEVFIRETIARATMQKKADAEEKGGVDDVDLGWLELEDLEKVAGAMLLDF